jgi:hypothetical protein
VIISACWYQHTFPQRTQARKACMAKAHYCFLLLAAAAAA